VTATVILTRRRAGAGFEYFKQTWEGMRGAWETNAEVRMSMAPRVQLDVSGLELEQAEADEADVRAIVGPGVVIWRFRAPDDLNFGGTKHAYWGALTGLLEGTAADDLLVLEDDLAFCKNGFLRMLTFPLPADLDWVTFFGPQILVRAKAWAGLWRVPAPSFGTLAIKFRRESLRRIVIWPAQSPDEFMSFVAGDQALDRCRLRHGMRFGLHVPELVEHRGAISTQGDHLEHEERSAKSWPGPEFDALTLFGRHELYL
jgi:hypothetical protein